MARILNYFRNIGLNNNYVLPTSCILDVWNSKYCKNIQCMYIIMQVFALGHENRSTGATKMNIYSSRSHALLCITVIGVSKSTGSQTIGRLLQYCYYNIHSKISQYAFHIATRSLPIYCKILLVWNKI